MSSTESAITKKTPAQEQALSQVANDEVFSPEANAQVKGILALDDERKAFEQQHFGSQGIVALMKYALGIVGITISKQSPQQLGARLVQFREEYHAANDPQFLKTGTDNS